MGKIYQHMEKIDLTINKYFDDNTKTNNEYKYNQNFGDNQLILKDGCDIFSAMLYHYDTRKPNILEISINRPYYIWSFYDYIFDRNKEYDEYSKIFGSNICDCCGKNINILNSKYTLCDPCNHEWDDNNLKI